MTNHNELLEKRAALDAQLASAALTENVTMKQDLRKIAEAVEGLVHENEELKKDNGVLAEAVGEKMEDATLKATNPATTEGLSDDAKEQLVEAVTNLDPDLADDLDEKIKEVEKQGEKVDADKVASLMYNIINTYAQKAGSNAVVGGKFASRTTDSFSKSASRGEEVWNDRFNQTLTKALKK